MTDGNPCNETIRRRLFFTLGGIKIKSNIQNFTTMIRKTILSNIIKFITKIFGRLAWYEADVNVIIRKGVKYAVLVFKAAGVVYEAVANYNKVGKAFYKSVVINGKFNTFF